MAYRLPRVTIARRGLLVLVALLALPGSAWAGTVSAPGFAGVEFDAAPGEANDVQVSRAGGKLRVEDRGAPLKAKGTCRSVSANAAECADEHLGWLVVVETGDGNDTVTVNTSGIGTTAVRLGAGDDKLDGSGRNSIYADGGDGADMLLGGNGPDIFQGGAGPDLLDGRGGLDQVYYEAGSEKTGVFAVLDNKANDGPPGENDDIRAEAIEGTNVHDILVGDDGDNVIIGHDGNDDVACLGGTDVVIVNDVFKPARDCENVTTGDPSRARVVPTAGQTVIASGGTAKVRTTVATEVGKRVSGSVQLVSSDGKLLGESTGKAKPGKRTITVTLNQDGQAITAPTEVEIVGLAVARGATAPTSLARTTGQLQPG
jgi:Ca2+-binding RTX toxin-like protein